MSVYNIKVTTSDRGTFVICHSDNPEANKDQSQNVRAIARMIQSLPWAEFEAGQTIWQEEGDKVAALTN